MSFANVGAPSGSPKTLIGNVRTSCKDARQAAGILICEEAADRFLLDVLPADPSKEEVAKWLTTGFRLPLAYDTVHDEINVLSILCFLNSLSGYRKSLHQALGHGAHKVIVQIVMSLYIGSANASSPLDAQTLASLTPMSLLSMLNLPTHTETPHSDLPAVVVGQRRRDDVYEALETLCVAANDAGHRLLAMKCRDLGTLVESSLHEASTEGKTDEERASLFVYKITNVIPAFNDACRLSDGSAIYIHKRAFLLLSWLHAAFHTRFDSSKVPPIPSPEVLPAFIDNVLPSLLVYFGILDLSNANDEALRKWHGDVKAVPLPAEKETRTGAAEVIEGPTFTKEQAYIVRAAALDAIHELALRAHILAKEKSREWLAQVNESLLDAWLWTQSKRPDLTVVPRMVEKKTFQY